MDERFSPLWLYIEENGVSSLTKSSLESFLKERGLSFFLDLDSTMDQDLFCFLFIEFENHFKNIEKDNDIPQSDQLFDILMQLADIYAPVQHLFTRVESDILTTPSLLKTFIFFKDKISKQFLEKLNIQNITVNASHIPYLSSYFLGKSFLVPKCLNSLAFSLILFCFLKIWMKDDYINFEKTMTDFQKILLTLNFS